MNNQKITSIRTKQHGPIQPNLINQNNYKEHIEFWNMTTNKGQALFYEFTTSSTLNHPIMIVPDTCLDIIVECDPHSPKAFFIGPNFKLKLLTLKPNTLYFGFKPYTEKGMCKNITYHYKDLGDEFVELQQLVDTEDICETLTMEHSFSERILTFKKFAQKHLINYDYKPDWIEYLLRLLCENTSDLPLSEIFTKVGYSERYCRKLFSDNYGIPPKQYSRIMRFQDTISCFSHPLNTLSADFNNLLSQNYYDQSHSTKDFKTFTNMPPYAFKQYILFQSITV